ncbi:hypothetical protein Osc7112_0961 [Oscillatoria nigro-viridis PCC 7112]|uniref:Uncharacterized protein n=1 Tax=Phormidium nigroviride PCC 7112 TaxID=179408 RepID=K9VDK1_9CYAN|nr:hypothetical protein Osc7112_0961 [Oscillatoria nigro-viridis PCC 7112]
MAPRSILSHILHHSQEQAGKPVHKRLINNDATSHILFDYLRFHTPVFTRQTFSTLAAVISFKYGD